VHYFESLGATVTTVLNDQLELLSVEKYDKIVISPGPGLPEEAGKMPEVINLYATKKPILGVCLGFQALFIYFGGQLYNQAEVQHGIAVNCKTDQKSRLFRNLPTEFKVGLYHSWAADPKTTPTDLIITGRSDSQVIMAFEHQFLPIYGVQFHPESVLTEHGMKILKNFLDDC
jgi:anthranilate synthase component 2